MCWLDIIAMDLGTPQRWGEKNVSSGVLESHLGVLGLCARWPVKTYGIRW